MDELQVLDNRESEVRKELLVGQLLKAIFEENCIRQRFSVLRYEIDYYIPECHLIIEYDKAETHLTKDEENKNRMEKIVNHLFAEWKNDPNSDPYDVERQNNPWNLFTVIRIREFEEHKGIGELLEFISGDARVYTKVQGLC